MPHAETTEIISRFNDAFLNHDPSLLAGLIADNCVMESIQPAPNGTRYEGRDACLAFWQALAADQSTRFDLENGVVSADRAVIRWRFRFGEGEENSVRGVNLMHIRDGQIVEALGYAEVPRDRAVDLPDGDGVESAA